MPTTPREQDRGRVGHASSFSRAHSAIGSSTRQALCQLPRMRPGVPPRRNLTRSCGEAARYETESKCEAASCRWVRGRQTEAAPTSAGDAASVTETDSGGVAVRDHALQHLGATLRFVESAREGRCEPILEEPVGVLLRFPDRDHSNASPSPVVGDADIDDLRKLGANFLLGEATQVQPLLCQPTR